jgi:RHS repeat-associated protein
LTWSAVYNGDGARLRQVANGVPTTYTLDVAAPLVQVLVQQDGSGMTRYLYGVTRVGEQQSAGWAYHLPDALGSVRQLADGNVQVTLARGYMPYGEALWSVGTGASAYGFTGEKFDASIGLVHLRARYYSPQLGRFFVRDAWSGNGQQPATLNPYLYGLNSPIIYTDPSGQICIAGFDIDFLGGPQCTDEDRQATAEELLRLAGFVSSPNFALGFAYEMIDAIMIIGPETARAAFNIMMDASPAFRDAVYIILGLSSLDCGPDLPTQFLYLVRNGIQGDDYFRRGRVAGRLTSLGLAAVGLIASAGGGAVAAASTPFTFHFGLAATTVAESMAAYSVAVVGSIAIRELNDQLLFRHFFGGGGGGDGGDGPPKLDPGELYGPNEGPEIALGHEFPTTGYPGLEEFAKGKGAKQYAEWQLSGLTPADAGGFSDDFANAMLRTKKAHFALDGTGYPDLKAALLDGAKGFGLGGGKYTNVELYEILHNSNWYGKTVFYFQGEVVSVPFIGGP